MQIITTIFSNIVLMGAMACVVIPIVWLARVPVGKVSKQLCFLLWGIVALRLIFPVMLPSEFSVFGYSDTLSRGLDYVRQQNAAGAGMDLRLSDITAETQIQTFGAQDANGKTYDTTFAEEETVSGDSKAEEPGRNAGLFWYHFVWLSGMAAMLSYAVISCLYIRRKLRFATRKEEGIYESETVGSPFVFGVFSPVIYLPYHLKENELSFILRHERYHIQRKDHLTRMFAYLLLSVYWFHPLVWVSYLLFLEDMETSCDEHVLENCDMRERRAYGNVLLDFAEERRKPVTGLGFGEGNMKRRMKHILAEKKKNLWATGAAVIFAAAIAFVCLTDQAKEKSAAEWAEELGVSEAAAALYADANPYIGDASADGRLLGTIHTYFGGLSDEFTTELQTSEEPYVMMLHFAEEPADEAALWRDAVLFLALTENCGEVRWDYEIKDSSTVKEQDYDLGEESGWIYVDEEWMPSEKMRMISCVSLADANANLGVENVKEYAASPERVEELLGLLAQVENDFYFIGILEKNADEDLASPQSVWLYTETDGTDVFVRNCVTRKYEELTPVPIDNE